MKNKMLIRALSALSVTMAFTACRVALETDLQNAYESTTRRSSGSQMVLAATLEAPEGETKTSLNSSQVLWTAGDQIEVFDAGGNHATYTLQASSAGKAEGLFDYTSGSPFLQDGTCYAVYPASAAESLSGKNLTINIPQAQTLTAGSFGNGANIAVAKAEHIDDIFHFKNVLGAVCIQLNNSITATRVRIQTKGAEYLCGSGTVNMSGDVPSLSIATGTTDNQIVEATGSATGTAFYLMLPPNALANGFITQVAAGSNAMLKEAPASESNKITRSGIVAMPDFAYENQIHTNFLDITPLPFGYYSGVGQNMSYQPKFEFNKATSQYATTVQENTSRTFRLQDFSTHTMYSFVLPYTLELGGEYSATMESILTSTYLGPADQGSFRLVQKTGNAAWFIRQDNAFGFIIPLED